MSQQKHEACLFYHCIQVLHMALRGIQLSIIVIEQCLTNHSSLVCSWQVTGLTHIEEPWRVDYHYLFPCKIIMETWQVF